MRARGFLPLVLTLALAVPAAGQQVRLMGRVLDDVTERPLGQATVTLLTSDGRVLGHSESADDGTFDFDVERVRSIRLQVQRASYRANTTPVLRFGGRNFFQVEVRLDPEAILLAPLEVVAWSEVDPAPFLDAFRQRVATGSGIYITRAQVESRRPMYVTDLLRDVAGLAVTGTGSGLRSTVQMTGRAAANDLQSDCPTQIFVDGFLVNRRTMMGAGPAADFRIDDVVSPSSVEGIEVYRGLSTVPAEFLTPDARCGVVAIWTRRGGRGG
jgi:hypothetical protein